MGEENPFASEISKYIDLIKERGPLTLWELAVIVETEAFRIKDRLEPVVEEKELVTFEADGRTFYNLNEIGSGSSGNGEGLFKMNLDFFRRKHAFQSIPKRAEVKTTMVEKCSYKKLITEAYILTTASEKYSEEQRVKTNLVVERDLIKLTTLEEKKLYLADFIYEKSIGKKKSYLKDRHLLGGPEGFVLDS
ncbi:MAG: hypothetical protein V3U74_05480 [Thermodesulfobacteriota bacterium]